MKMNEKMFAVMRDAMHLLKTKGPGAATEVIQRTLKDALPAEPADAGKAQSAAAPAAGSMRDINPAPARRVGGVDTFAGLAPELRPESGRPSSERTKSDMPASAPGFDRAARTPNAGGAQFLAGSYTNHAGTRNYKLYIPAGYHGQPLPLVVMLHGCTQNPDDFAAGTRMNAIAEEKPCLVVYPAQSQSANGSKCWNWFNAIDQQRDQGEPSIIAGITREIIDTYHVDPQQVYIAGLSAGGAMAVIMGTTYPDLYAAVGIHSGLPYAAADDLPSALAAMKGGMGMMGRQRNARASAPGSRSQAVPIILFHGDKDRTVHPSNGDQIMAQSMPAAAGGASGTRPEATVQHGRTPDGHAYTRTSHHDESGNAIAEQWLVHGAGHAWFGGSSLGSYTDAKGPDASQEMMRFFSTRAQRAQ
ncbi:MAG: esterase [Herminiimonas sp.]|nr:esterase [Herminiimonas sp.]